MTESVQSLMNLAELNFVLALALRAPKYPFEEMLLKGIIERLNQPASRAEDSADPEPV